jgi:aerobic-type carbon monoxide dehydrogenase small subunit (CoxS/CutS family)
MRLNVSFTLNGQPVRLETDDQRSLLWTLRTDLGLTGTKYGCGAGLCGSCTVVVDGKAVRSCRASLAEVQGKKVTTIEGLATGGKLHPIQQAFVDRGGFQCGYCTPGMIMSAHGLLLADPHPSREKVVDAMEGNLCRCSAYKRILEAIESVARAEGGRP